MSDFEERSGIIACTTEWGKWYQTLEDVNLEIDLNPGTRGREVKVDITSTRLHCQIRATVIIKGRLFDNVIEDDSTWTIEDQKLLRILLVKSRKSSYWESLLEGGVYQPDPAQLLGMRQKLDLERLQLENPGLDFSGAKLDKQYPDMPSYLHSDLDQLGAAALPVSIGDNKTDDEKLLESQTRLGDPADQPHLRRHAWLPEPALPSNQQNGQPVHHLAPALLPDPSLPEPQPADNRLLESVDRLSVETDDMKQREGSDVSSSSASSMAVSSMNGASSSMAVSTSSTDDMKTEPLRVVAPVVTDDMKTEENESLETDEEKSGN